MPKLLLKEVLLVLLLLSAHLKPKVSKFSEDCSLLDLAGLIYHFFFSIIFYPKKSVEKNRFTQYFQAEEYGASLCSI